MDWFLYSCTHTHVHTYWINFNGHTTDSLLLLHSQWMNGAAHTYLISQFPQLVRTIHRIDISMHIHMRVCLCVGRCVYVLLIVYTLFERIPTKITNEAKQIEEKQQQSQRIKKNQRQLLRKQTILWWLVVLCC